MSTSGTYAFNPSLEQVLAEAWERCGKDPADLDMRHAISARRSLNLMLTSEFSAAQFTLWTVASRTVTPSSGDNSFALSQGAIDVLEAVVRDTDGNDILMEPIGRAEWMAISDKDQQGSHPDRFWVQKTSTGTGTNTFNFWQAMDDSGSSIVINELFRIEDAGNLTNEPEVPTLWLEAVCAGLAQRLALKWAPDRFPLLKGQYDEALRLARSATFERGSIFIQPDYRR